MIVTKGECRLYTRREGALAAVGHDLALRAARWTVDLRPEARAVTATVEAASIAVVCAQRSGVDDPGALSAGDRAKIDRAARSEVLRVDRFAAVVFEGGWSGDAPEAVDGSLTLCGVTRPLRVRLARGPAGLVATATVHQPTWGIAPFRAMMGALRVQADVLVEWTIEGV